MSFGKRLKELRERKSMTQQELADALKINRSRLSLYEIDDRQPDHQLTVEIANFFEVTTDYLLGRTDDPKGHKSTTIAAHRLDDPTTQLPEEARKSLEDFKKFIFEKHGIKYD